MGRSELEAAVVASTCESCPDMVEGGMERVIEAKAMVREAALDYAALLPDETGNHNPELLHRVAAGLFNYHHETEFSRASEDIREGYEQKAVAVLGVITGDEK